MSRCIIILPLYEGEAIERVRKQPGDLLLCADAGYACAVAAGLTPDGVIGDFDSMPRAVVGDCPVIALPTHKDDTDTEHCMAVGRERGYHSFLLAGGIGGRLDHTMTNIQLLYDAALRGEEAVLLGGLNEARILMPGCHRLPRRAGYHLSLLAYTPEVTGLTLRGVEYQLTDHTLVNHTSLGVSNEWTAEEAVISFTGGALLTIYAKDASLQRKP